MQQLLQDGCLREFRRNMIQPWQGLADRVQPNMLSDLNTTFALSDLREFAPTAGKYVVRIQRNYVQATGKREENHVPLLQAHRLFLFVDA
jgi:hypothetical protein